MLIATQTLRFDDIPEDIVTEDPFHANTYEVCYISNFANYH